jgi:preprotein translocase subunit SecG
MGEQKLSSPIFSMTKGFLIVICIIIAIALIIFPLLVSYKAQKNKKNKN